MAARGERQGRTFYYLHHSVGANGTNRYDDVMLVQLMLRLFARYDLDNLLSHCPLKVDGSYGPRTLFWLMRFQEWLGGIQVATRVETLPMNGSGPRGLLCDLNERAREALTAFHSGDIFDNLGNHFEAPPALKSALK